MKVMAKTADGNYICLITVDEIKSVQPFFEDPNNFQWIEAMKEGSVFDLKYILSKAFELHNLSNKIKNKISEVLDEVKKLDSHVQPGSPLRKVVEEFTDNRFASIETLPPDEGIKE